MRGKPYLVAVAAFVIVLFGGAAIAGVGSFRDQSNDSAGVSPYAAPSTDLDVAEWTPTTKAEAPVETTTTTPQKEKEAVETKTESGKDHGTKSDENSDEDTSDEKEKDHKEEAKETKAGDLFSLTFPKDGSHVTKKVVAFGGEAAEGVIVHRGKYSAQPKNGEWVMELVLSPGKNTVGFKAINEAGGIDEAVVTVYYDAPAGDEEKKEKPKSEFYAKQKYGSCGEEVPYDVFWGKAMPGATITASSPYGGNSVTANAEGHWEMKVTFASAPVGKTFEVGIKASTGEKKGFKFTNTGGGGDH
ncbi:MAG: hypothetical protein ACR2N2_04150 [Acidimicrobiia bacterium]